MNCCRGTGRRWPRKTVKLHKRGSNGAVTFDLEHIADELEALSCRDPDQAKMLEAGLASLRERPGVYRKLSGLNDDEDTDPMLRELIERQRDGSFLVGEEGEQRTRDMIKRKSEDREEDD